MLWRAAEGSRTGQRRSARHNALIAARLSGRRALADARRLGRKGSGRQGETRLSRPASTTASSSASACPSATSGVVAVAERGRARLRGTPPRATAGTGSGRPRASRVRTRPRPTAGPRARPPRRRPPALRGRGSRRRASAGPVPPRRAADSRRTVPGCDLCRPGVATPARGAPATTPPGASRRAHRASSRLRCRDLGRAIVGADPERGLADVAEDDRDVERVADALDHLEALLVEPERLLVLALLLVQRGEAVERRGALRCRGSPRGRAASASSSRTRARSRSPSAPTAQPFVVSTPQSCAVRPAVPQKRNRLGAELRSPLVVALPERHVSAIGKARCRGAPHRRDLRVREELVEPPAGPRSHARARARSGTGRRSTQARSIELTGLDART